MTLNQLTLMHCGEVMSTMCLLLHLGNPGGGSALWELSSAVNVHNVLCFCFWEMPLSLERFEQIVLIILANICHKFNGF